MKVKLNRKVLYELDGGDREKVKTFTVKVRARRRSRLRPQAGARAEVSNGAT